MQLLASLLSGLKAACAAFPDSRKGRGGNIAITDFGLAAFSMFFMQSSSFLAFQRALEKGQGRSNGQTLFGIGRIPSDNYIRGALDEADPSLLRRTNPLNYLSPGLPPFLIQHGDNDDLVPVEQSFLLADHLRAYLKSEDIRVDVLLGSLHGGPAFDLPDNLIKVTSFLAAVLRPVA